MLFYIRKISLLWSLYASNFDHYIIISLPNLESTKPDRFLQFYINQNFPQDIRANNNNNDNNNKLNSQT